MTDEGNLMRGLWENEKTLSPALLRSALALVGAFLALSSAVMLVIGVSLRSTSETLGRL